jgi:hypothetical protein
MAKKTYLQKLQSNPNPEVKICDIDFADIKAGEKMLIASPKIFDEYISKIPKGKLATKGYLRKTLANDFHADKTCPLTTGIFINIVGGAAEENRSLGNASISPYWRVISDEGKLNPKFPGGVVNQAHLLQKEGFEVIEGRGKDNIKVKDFEKFIIN